MQAADGLAEAASTSMQGSKQTRMTQLSDILQPGQFVRAVIIKLGVGNDPDDAASGTYICLHA